MGYKLVAAGLDTELPTSTNPNTGIVKAVFLALLDRTSNDTHTCYPSMNDLSRRSQVSISSVKRSIYLLETYGYVTAMRRTRAGKKANDSNLYTVNFDKLGSDGTDPSIEENRPLGARRTDPRVEEERKPVNEPVNKPVNKPVGKKSPKDKRSKSITDDFEVTQAMKDWFSEKRFQFSINDETEKFINHHIAKGSTFVEPSRAWQNWMSGRFTPQSKKTKVQPENFAGKDYGQSTFTG
jgi:DNA-binding transcriptional regulator YhcF (GntR family)